MIDYSDLAKQKSIEQEQKLRAKMDAKQLADKAQALFLAGAVSGSSLNVDTNLIAFRAQRPH